MAQEERLVGHPEVPKIVQVDIRRTLQNQRLPTGSTDDPFAVSNVKSVEECEGLKYSYYFNTYEDVLQTLG